MREWAGWHGDLVRRLSGIADISLSKRECQLFFEVEYCLRLREHLIPTQSAFDTWTLFTGYSVAGVNDTPATKRKCLIARQRVRYLRTETSWRKWLTWYREQREDFRLYEIDMETGHCDQRSPLMVLPERIEIYDDAIDQTALHRHRSTSWAKAGHYRFPVLGEMYSVHIPGVFSEQKHPDIPDEPPAPRKRDPIEIHFDDLERIARTLDLLDPQGNWARRANNLSLDLVQQGRLHARSRTFTLDGIFHLVGMVGAGKSTLIFLLIYYLAVERKLHITLVLNTIAESIHMAETLRRLGIAAAPALGTNRGEHRAKYGQAHAQNLQIEDVFQLGAGENAALQWVTAPCAVSGLMTEGSPLPSGHEPCYSLMNAKDQSYSCPLRPTCPVHQASQDLITSQVWIVNPASFIYSRAPEGLCKADVRLLEAVYRMSDVLLIDEADRVQVQWDRAYAPVDNLAGNPEALIDWLDVTITEQLIKRERRPLRHTRHKELNMVAGEADRLSSHLLHMLFNHPDLVEWMHRMPVTNSVIYAQLLSELARPHPDADVHPLVHTTLTKEFQLFYEQPLSLFTGSDLSMWINDARYDETGELSRLLLDWLQKRVPWPLEKHPEYERLVRRLEFGLVLTAMDKRVDDLLRNWLWAATEFGQQRQLDHSPPQEYIDLVPESPLGNLLGYQYLERKSSDGGLLKYIQCYGIGRWLLSNFHSLYNDLDGFSGPHVLLTSATSWAPGSPQYHLIAQPNAILTPPKEERVAIDRSFFDFIPVPQKDGTLITISGIQGEDRQKNLVKLVRYLANTSDSHQSRIEQELTHWRQKGTPRKVLLIVGSYAEAEIVTKVLLEIPGLRQRVTLMLPDEDDSLDAWVIRRGEVEQLINHKADVLVAPLLAIQRGFNILDDAGGALLGSAFFLVRPYPVPDDLGQHVIGINHWMQTLLGVEGNTLPNEYGTTGSEAMKNLRRTAYKEWNRRLSQGQFGLDGLPNDLYKELLWDQFVVVWQTIGRLVRRGREARVFFVDAAFHPRGKRRSLLKGWHTILEEYFGSASKKTLLEQQFAETLYGSAYKALSTLITRLEKEK